MEIIYNDKSGVEFGKLEIGDVFIPDTDGMRTAALRDLHLKIEHYNKLSCEVGSAVNLRTCEVVKFYKDVKVIKKDVVLTVK